MTVIAWTVVDLVDATGRVGWHAEPSRDGHHIGLDPTVGVQLERSGDRVDGQAERARREPGLTEPDDIGRFACRMLGCRGQRCLDVPVGFHVRRI